MTTQPAKLYGIRVVWKESPDGGRRLPHNFWKSHGDNLNDPITFNSRAEAIAAAAKLNENRRPGPRSNRLVVRQITPKQLANQRAWIVR